MRLPSSRLVAAPSAATTRRSRTSLRCSAAGRTLVVVHGGGNAATEWLKIHGIASEFVDGLRVTSADAIDVVTAVFAGLVNKQLVAEPAGARRASLRAERRRRRRAADASARRAPRLRRRGHGRRTAVRSMPCSTPATCRSIAPVGFWGDQPSQLMNINADTVAGEVAAALGATDLVFLTDVAYVRDGEGEALDELRAAEVKSMIESRRRVRRHDPQAARRRTGGGGRRALPHRRWARGACPEAASSAARRAARG